MSLSHVLKCVINLVILTERWHSILADRSSLAAENNIAEQSSRKFLTLFAVTCKHAPELVINSGEAAFASSWLACLLLASRSRLTLYRHSLHSSPPQILRHPCDSQLARVNASKARQNKFFELIQMVTVTGDFYLVLSPTSVLPFTCYYLLDYCTFTGL